MLIRTRELFILGLSALVLLAGGIARGEALRKVDPVIIPGDHLDGLMGAGPADIRVFAYSGGQWSPIPFQVDERLVDKDYQTWTTRATVFSYAFDVGPHTSDEDPAFDADDELVFMAANAGDQAETMPSGAQKCDEVALNDPLSGNLAYVYACVAPGGAVSDKRYVNTDASFLLEPQTFRNTLGLFKEEGPGALVVDASGYRIEYPAGNPVNFTTFQVRGQDGLMLDVVDRMKQEFKVSAVFGVAGYRLADNDYKHFIRGVKVGPVRVIVEYESVLETWADCQIRTYNHNYFYPYHVEYDILARSPANWGFDIHTSQMIMAVDLDDWGRGMKFYSQNNQKGVDIDGYTSPDELLMDYGPTEWAAVTGEKAGTIMVHMGLTPWTELHKDLYYVDNDAKGGKPEDIAGMVGMFGYMLRDVQHAGFEPWSVRFAVYGNASVYEPGMEDALVNIYKNPLVVNVGPHQLRSVKPEAAMIKDEREERPGSSFKAQQKTYERTQFIIPNFIIDPNLLGIGPGIGYSDIDFMGTGVSLGVYATWTDRGYSSYDFSVSELRFIEGVQAFRFGASYGSFPAEPFYGVGNDTDKDELTLYWWNKTEVNMNFKKYFADIYGADFRVGYRFVEIDSGIEPVSGEGEDSIEERFGFNNEIVEERYGPPVYGRDGGNHTGFSITLYRDMRNSKRLPKFGNYQEAEVSVVTSALGADYDYANVRVDLRGYWYPEFLNPIPFLDGNINPRRDWLNKFYGMDKNRVFALRLQFYNLIAEEIDWYGQEILDVPFYDLNTIGSSGTVKGFRSKRFRGNDMVLASIEYRWRWWRFQDVALFYDIGMVMDDMFVEDDWDGTWHDGYGVSYRLAVEPNITLTFEFSWSEEEAAYQQQMNMVF